MAKIIGNAFLGIVAVCFIAFVAWTVYIIPEPVKADYSFKIDVDKTEKIETAISNVVADIKRRDFVMISLDVSLCPGRNCYRVIGRGIDRGKLLKDH